LVSESNPRITKKSNTPYPVPTFTPLAFLRASVSTRPSWVSIRASGTTDTLAGVVWRSTASSLLSG
jgi:hypothetical protein